ncbi:MAG: class I SAM-dependent methyltransferase [Campylobacterales bacterium]|nr:class I SAM-dependent methyltransferase [Campylobacterales bacterium]
MANTTDSLDLYAKVEDLLGVKEAAPRLYAHYLLFLNSVDCSTLLDVGCGSGDFLFQMQKALEIDTLKGIDLSPVMVENTQKKGIDAACIDLCHFEGRFDVITAVFDMLNYLNPSALEHFLGCVYEHLHAGGFFLCDINTRYGFEQVAVGSYIVDDEDRFLAIDSDFEKDQYISEFTLFEKENDGCFRKSQETIRQYYHPIEKIVRSSGLKLVEKSEVNLYDLDDADKHFLVLQKI